MKTILTCLTFSLGLAGIAFAENRSKADKISKENPKEAAPMATNDDSVAVKSRRPNESEIGQLKDTLSNNSASLKQKMQALVKLAETEGADISEFLTNKKNQLDAELKTAQPSAKRDLKNLRVALDRVISARPRTAVATVE